LVPSLLPERGEQLPAPYVYTEQRHSPCLVFEPLNSPKT